MKRTGIHLFCLAFLCQSIHLVAQSTFQSENISLEEKFTDGPLTYNLAATHNLEVISGFVKNALPANCTHTINLGNNLGKILLSAQKEDDFDNLDHWANRQKYSWLKSENGEILQANKFLTNSGYTAIAMTRKTDISEEFVIVLDLSNEDWVNDLGISPDSQTWLRVVIHGHSSNPISYPTALAIARSIDYQGLPTYEGESLSEILPKQTYLLPILDREINHGPLIFSLPNQSKMESKIIYSEHPTSTNGEYSIHQEDKTISFELNSEFEFDSLEDWAINQKNAWNNSSNSEVLTLENFYTRFGHSAISIVREFNSTNNISTLEYKIAIDLTTDLWKDRQKGNWLKVIFSGSDSNNNSVHYLLSRAIANSLHLNDSSPINKVAFSPTESSSVIYSNENYSSFSDGPVNFFRPDNLSVNCLSTYSSLVPTLLSEYELIDLSTYEPSPSFSVKKETRFLTLDEWAINLSESWKNSENTSEIFIESFLTDFNRPGVSILRMTTDMKYEYQIGVSLEQQSSHWISAHFSENKLHDDRKTFDVTRSIAQTISFNSAEFQALSKDFKEVTKADSSSTGFPVSIDGFNWFSSYWFGPFWESGKNWIFHYWLGWIYSHPSEIGDLWFWTERSGWIWSNKKVYPYLYSTDLNDWLLLQHENSSVRCYDYSRRKWSSWETFFSFEQVDPSTLGSKEHTQYELKELKKSELSSQEQAKAAARIILGKN